MKPYVVLQVVLKEKLIGTGSGNLTELENIEKLEIYLLSKDRRHLSNTVAFESIDSGNVVIALSFYKKNN